MNIINTIKTNFSTIVDIAIICGSLKVCDLAQREYPQMSLERSLSHYLPKLGRNLYSAITQYHNGAIKDLAKRILKLSEIDRLI